MATSNPAPEFEPANPISGGIGADGPYWTALDNGELRISACRGCQQWQWPADYRCGLCGSWDLDWHPVDPAGSVFSWTTTHMPFPRVQARADQVPYTTALVELDGLPGVRVFGVLDAAEVSMGMAVRGEIDPPADRSLGYPSLRWVPAARSAGANA